MIGKGDRVPDMIMLRPFEQEHFDRLVELARNRFDTALTQPETQVLMHSAAGYDGARRNRNFAVPLS